MIRYNLNIPAKKLPFGLDYRKGIIFSGSCFSEHFSKRLKESYFKVFGQANGIVFNPLSIADPFERVFSHIEYTEDDLIFNQSYWHSKYHHGSFSEQNKSDLLKKINQNLHALKQNLKDAGHLFITFASAYVYEGIDDGKIVANCHKIPQTLFRKRLLKVEEITNTWSALIENLQKSYPALHIVFTISPVKHIKDGIIENTRSKAVLFVALEELMERFSTLQYFPAYELVNDDLRDYRFYESDGAHPNSIAIDFVYEKFKEAVFDENSLKFSDEISRYLKMNQHRFLREDGEEYLHFMKNLEGTRVELNAKFGLDL